MLQLLLLLSISFLQLSKALSFDLGSYEKTYTKAPTELVFKTLALWRQETQNLYDSGEVGISIEFWSEENISEKISFLPTNIKNLFTINNYRIGAPNGHKNDRYVKSYSAKIQGHDLKQLMELPLHNLEKLASLSLQKPALQFQVLPQTPQNLSALINKYPQDVHDTIPLRMSKHYIKDYPNIVSQFSNPALSSQLGAIRPYYLWPNCHNAVLYFYGLHKRLYYVHEAAEEFSKLKFDWLNSKTLVPQAGDIVYREEHSYVVLGQDVIFEKANFLETSPWVFTLRDVAAEYLTGELNILRQKD